MLGILRASRRLLRSRRPARDPERAPQPASSTDPAHTSEPQPTAEVDFFQGYEEVVQTEQPLNAMLTLCPTPIGNLGDMTFRAYSALRRADLIVCEDSRVVSMLLNTLPKYKGGAVPALSRFPSIDEYSYAFSSDSPQSTAKKVAHCKEKKGRGLLISFTSANEASRTASIVKAMKAGLSVALASSAGTPLLAAPGKALVAAAVQSGVTVDSLPGPTAAVVALTAAGFYCENFRFEGYLPADDEEKEQRLRAVKEANCATIVYAQSQELVRTLAVIEHVYGMLHRLYVGQDLTKPQETHHHGIANDIVEKFNTMESVAGDFTIVIAPPEQRKPANPDEATVKLGELVKAIEENATLSREEEIDVICKLSGVSRPVITKLLKDLKPNEPK